MEDGEKRKGKEGKGRKKRKKGKGKGKEKGGRGRKKMVFSLHMKISKTFFGGKILFFPQNSNRNAWKAL